MSRYDAADEYVYPGTTVLRNKADIRDHDALDAFEADATAVRMLELLEQPIAGCFDFLHLCGLHRHLFQDVYEWAGEVRTVDISRDSSRFAHAPMIEGYLAGELGKIANENGLRGLTPERFVARLAHYMGEINAAHPFREGNGRTQRVFCVLLAEQAGYFIDFETVDQARMYEVMMASFNGNALPLEALLWEITSIIGTAT
ncbi:Fic family protein [Polaromonas sp. CG_9.11]|uniref:Fic/DOC family protein n=1 Tax=Polaromonas sp. CG_9.11 TaxID=2787730 RepID=UPI0018C93050|nr:Fic family protein [Polaromonas sp. CG_9.11]MBG6075362.1 cell filamentation protein [Polaromonas sp. CG_9.11]